MSEPTNPPGPPSNTPPPPPGGGAPPASPPGTGAGAPPPPPPPAGGGSESPNRGLMIVLSYVWLLALIPLLTEKEDREVQWHAKHGLVLLGAELIVAIGLFIVGSVVAMIDLGCTGCILQTVFLIAVFVTHVLCIMKGLNGERFLIPGVSQFADRF